VPPAFFEAMVQESLKVPAHVWKAATEGLLEEDHSAELGKIKTPTLIIWGDQDTFTRSDQETLMAAIAGSRLVCIAAPDTRPIGRSQNASPPIWWPLSKP